jgi:hypothetical protein
MRAGRPLSLDDSQLAKVLSGARCLHPAWRSRYLEAVADRLLPLPRLTDEAVKAAVDDTIRRMIPPRSAP